MAESPKALELRRLRLNHWKEQCEWRGSVECGVIDAGGLDPQIQDCGGAAPYLRLVPMASRLVVYIHLAGCIVEKEVSGLGLVQLQGLRCLDTRSTCFREASASEEGE
ncbi:hypothetical protein FH972_023455 [Carpinus fangiana]|uniref:Uncharacterized protein n=1 Tax=Carpinus fangiana TaxID=176857 RepID=A0A5N6KVQ2_9ROSI|nr:hypothetical protein FH972_023455 [Carpinus fangiana]